MMIMMMVVVMVVMMMMIMIMIMLLLLLMMMMMVMLTIPMVQEHVYTDSHVTAADGHWQTSEVVCTDTEVS